ncbi:MAG: DUF5677 domain-containing protein [Desulfobaccales bacterium]
MEYEIPSINDLLDIYEGDPDWSELQSIYNKLTDIVHKCLVELHPFLIKNTSFLPDDRHYILLYLFRTKRIFNSIVLLLIYECYAEAKMLQRAFLENIVDTKLFIKVGRRARNKRKIKLYHLLNEKRRYELYMEDYRESKEKYGKIVTSVAIAKMNEKLEQRINEGFKYFEESEITEMELKVNKGLSWHGFKPKGAFKRCGMKHEYEDYNMACTFVHIRDWPFPSGLVTGNDSERKTAIQSEFNTTLGLLASHLEDFVQYCPNTFSDRVDDKIKKLLTNIDKLQNNLAKNMLKEEYTELGEFIIIPDEE